MKTKTSFYSVIAVLVFVIFSLGCSDESERYSTITIYDPTPNQAFALGDTVFVNALITANIELHGYSVEIKNLSSGEEMHAIEQHSHGGNIPVGTFWINTVSENSNMRAYVIAHIDDNGKHEIDSVDFVCNQ